MNKILTKMNVSMKDYNANGHAGNFEIPKWAEDLYKGQTDEQVFNDFVETIYDKFRPLIGIQMDYLIIANEQYFLSDRITGNVKRALYKEVNNFRMNVPFENRNNATFNLQGGFNFSLSVSSDLVNYDFFTRDTRAFLQDTGLINVCIEDLECIPFWTTPTFKTGEELKVTGISREVAEKGPVMLPTKVMLDLAIKNEKERADNYADNLITGSHKQIAGTFYSNDFAEVEKGLLAWNAGTSTTFPIIDAAGNPVNYVKNGVTGPGQIGSQGGDIILLAYKAQHNPSDAPFDVEEIIILNDMSASLLTHNNKNTGIVNGLDGRVTTIENQLIVVEDQQVKNITDIAKLKTDKVSIDGTINMNTSYIPQKDSDIAVIKNLKQSITDLKAIIEGGATGTTLKNLLDTINILLGRVKDIEDTMKQSENIWSGKYVFAGTGKVRTYTIKAIQGDDGVFDYTVDKNLILTIKDSNGGATDTETVIISPKGTLKYKTKFNLTAGKDKVQVSIDTDGLMTVTALGGASATYLDTVEAIHVVQILGGGKVIYVTPAQLNDLRTALQKDIDLKQAINDIKLITPDKSIVDAINGVFSAINAIQQLMNGGVTWTGKTSDIIYLNKSVDNLDAHGEKVITDLNFTQNSNLLTKNDTNSTKEAHIGSGYKGDQTHGQFAKGNQFYGFIASGEQTYGKVALGYQSYGEAASGEQSHGKGASGNQSYGIDATGKVEIAFSENGASNKIEFKQNNADDKKMWLYVDNKPKISFRDIANTKTYVDSLATNSFGGTFTTPTKFMEFMGITDTINDSQFKNEDKLTAINILKARSIGDYAFFNSKLTTLDLPLVTTIGENSFFHSKLTTLNIPNATSIGDTSFLETVNASSTHVTMKSKFNTPAEKDRIFNYSWDKITFTWV